MSAALYLTVNIAKINMPGFPMDSGWYFNPLAWQLIFAIGLGTWHPASTRDNRFRGTRSLPRLRPPTSVTGSCGTALSVDGGITFGLLPNWVDTLSKSNLPLSRLATWLALAYLIVHSPLWPRLQKLGAKHWFVAPLRLMGKYSLPVFVIGSLVEHGWLPDTGAHWGRISPLEIAITIIGLSMLVAVGWGLR